MVASSGYIAQVEADLCAACGECEDACPFDAVYVEDTAVVDWAGCMGCGVCVDRCTTGAVTLVADGRKGVPLDVRAL
jgi:electron transport complex protein RnfB